MKDKKLIIFREVSFNIILALYFVFFASIHLAYFIKTQSIPTFLFIFYESFIVFLALFRSIPKEVCFDFKSWLAASVGTYLPMMFTSNRYEFDGDIVFWFFKL